MIRVLRNLWIAGLLLILSSALATAQGDTLRIISYNTYKGMRLDPTPRKSVFVNWVRRHSPDILALQEANFTLAALEAMAHEYGHEHVIMLQETRIALTSRFPITKVDRVVDGMHRGYIKVTTARYNFAVLHLSPFKFSERKHDLVRVLEDIRIHGEQEDWVIMGDFNAHSPIDSIYYCNGLVRASVEERERIYPNHSNLVNGKLDYSVIQQVLAADFRDALNLRNRNGLQVTFPTRRFQDERPAARIDFIFMGKQCAEKLIDADVVRDDFTHNYSDHYPIMITLIN